MTTVAPDLRNFRYVVNPDDPRAPPTDVWNMLSVEERRRVVSALPSEFELSVPPEGDRHFLPKVAAQDTLGRHFRRVGRKVYVSGELPIYYPGQRMFSADLVAVLDVELRERDSWVVDVEGKGLDFALEIHVKGDRRKDVVKNVEKYARLGIPEYFVFDRARGDLHGYRLVAPKAGVYERIVAQQGKLESRVLGLELVLSGNKLRFLVGDAAVPEVDELLLRLGGTLDEVMASKQEAERRAEQLEQELEAETQRREGEQRLREEEQRLREEETRLREEEQQKREAAEQKLGEVQAEVERLRRSLKGG